MNTTRRSTALARSISVAGGVIAFTLLISLFSLLQGTSMPSVQAYDDTSPQAVDVPGDEAWDDRFGVPGLEGGFVEAVAVVGNDVYFAGSFTSAGNISANRIVRWNGSAWFPVSTGINGPVHALATDGTNLYAAGEFSLAGGYSVGNVAKWDGTIWSTLSNGAAGAVYSLAYSSGNLYIGGRFTTVDGIEVNNIARWDGSHWFALGTGMDGLGSRDVFAIAASGSTIYAGGNFTQAGGVSASRIAKWNGTQWSALGSGMNDNVLALVIDNSTGALYAGGAFTSAGGVPAACIARWNGTQWSAVSGGTDSIIESLAIGNGYLYAGGRFVSAGGVEAHFIARWDGISWSPLGEGLGSDWGSTNFLSGRDIAISGSNVYVAGEFTGAGPIGSKRVARWDGTQWHPLGPFGGALNGAIYRLVQSPTGSDIYAGGSFPRAGGIVGNRIARWDGNQWNALGGGVDGNVWAIAFIGNDMYVGGEFTHAGGVPANGIARWDGSAWHPLGSGVTGIVYALAAIGGNLYAGGTFIDAGGTFVRYVAKWNGSAWSSLGTGQENGTGSYVYQLASDGINLYLGGEFTFVGNGTYANHVAMWNGIQWSAVGVGLNGIVRALVMDGSTLYAGGEFLTTGNNTNVGYIARWDGNQWSALGSGVNNNVYGITTMGSYVYATGIFDTATGVSANRIARWNGNTWQGLGSGLDGVGMAVLVQGGSLHDVHVGGSISLAGNKPSFGMGIWHEQSVVTATATRTATPVRTVTPVCFSPWENIPGPTRNGPLAFTDVAALAPDNVWAVGTYVPTGGEEIRPVIEHWDGQRWSIVHAPLKPGGYSLAAIDAISANNIWAAGPGPTFVHYDGSTWSLVPAPAVYYGNIEDLDAISANDIWAVGQASLFATLAMHWDGVEWSVVPTPNGAPYSNDLHGVFAVSSNDVWAVGECNQNSSSLTLHWDGSVWTIVATPQVGSAGDRFFTVGGSASTDIWVLGEARGGPGAAILHWDGSSWEGSSTPDLPALPVDMDIISATDIWVAGYVGVQTTQAMVSHWDGIAWSTTFFPMGPYSNELNGIDVVGSDIWAVGQQYSGRTLALHRHNNTCGQATATPYPQPTAPPARQACGNYAYSSEPGAVVPGDTLVPGSQCNDCAVGIALPFTYSFYGQPYDSIQLGSNGIAAFVPGENDLINECIPLEGMLATIAVYWDNLDMSDTAGPNLGIFTSISGDEPNRIFNIEWRACRRRNGACDGTVNVELRLYEGQDRFDVVLGEQSNTNGSASIGAQADGISSFYTALTCNLAYAQPSQIIFNLGYPDVRPDSAFYRYVNCLSCQDVISGYTDGTFRPGNDVTRGQLSKIVSNSAGFNDDPGPQLFEDMPQGSTFYDWVNRLANRGYISGYPCGGEVEPCGPGNLPYFRPNANATRGQISKIVSNAAGYDDEPPAQTFQDVPPSNAFFLWIERLASRGIMGGYPCGSPGEPCSPGNRPYFRWGNNATRGQTSKIVANTFFPNCNTLGH